MSGTIHKHTLVYTVVPAGVLAAFFNLSRIDSLGAIFYFVMDIGRSQIFERGSSASGVILVSAIILDVIVLRAFVVVKTVSDPLIVGVAGGAILTIFGLERLFLKNQERGDDHSQA